MSRILVLAILVTRIEAAGLYTASCSGFNPIPDQVTSATAFTGINNSGDIVGFEQDDATSYPIEHGFLYSGGKFNFFGAAVSAVLTGSGESVTVNRSTAASAINSIGQIVGATQFGPGTEPLAYIYTNGVLKTLCLLPGTARSFATALNDSGQVVGYAIGVTQCGSAGCQPPQVGMEAFLYSGGSLTALGYLPGGTKSYASAINNAGQIVGWSFSGPTATNPSPHQEAFVIRGGVMTGLGTLPGFTDSVATGINDKGQIVGYAHRSYFVYPGDYLVNVYRAFLYSDGIMMPLGPDSGLVALLAVAINNEGQVVGSASYGDGPLRGFLYSGGRIYDLNSLAPGASNQLSYADAINDSGQIIANGFWLTSWPFGEDRSYRSEYCLLTPPPQGAVGGFVPTTTHCGFRHSGAAFRTAP